MDVAIASCLELPEPDFDEAPLTAALEAAFDAASRCDLLFSVGTSALVEPAAAGDAVDLGQECGPQLAFGPGEHARRLGARAGIGRFHGSTSR